MDLNYLFDAAFNGNIEVITRFLETGGELTSRDIRNRSILHFATSGGQTSLVSMLLSAEPTLANLRDSEGNSALSYALKYQNSELIACLLSETDVNQLDLVELSRYSSGLGLNLIKQKMY
jgi:ankyrin repeat protein